MEYKLLKKWNYSEILDDGRHTPIGVNEYYHIYEVDNERRYYKVDCSSDCTWPEIERYYPFKQQGKWMKAVVQEIDYDAKDYQIISYLEEEYKYLFEE